MDRARQRHVTAAGCVCFLVTPFPLRHSHDARTDCQSLGRRVCERGRREGEREGQVGDEVLRYLFLLRVAPPAFVFLLFRSEKRREICKLTQENEKREKETTSLPLLLWWLLLL